MLFATAQDEFYPAHHSEALAAALSAAGLPQALLQLPLLPHATEGGEAGIASQMVRFVIDHILQAGAAGPVCPRRDRAN